MGVIRKLHLSKRFLSRERGFNMVILCDNDFYKNRANRREIKEIARTYAKIYVDLRDEIWCGAIKEIDCDPSSPISLLYFQNDVLQIQILSNILHLRLILFEVVAVCDKIQ